MNAYTTPLPLSLAASLLLAGCAEEGSAPLPFEELRAQGIDRYLGAFEPERSDDEGDLVVHEFDGADGGPLCFTGQDFHMATRDGASEDLLIFLQGGGVCGPNGCEAVEGWPPGIPALGLLGPSVEGNPAAEHDVGYLPYCDGSTFLGDREVDDDGDGVVDRSFRGLKNLSASLDVIVEAYPAPARVLLAGNSAGGASVHYALPLVRQLYPDVPIDLINDSGVGILAPGVQDELNAYWGSGYAFPESCADCIGPDGHLTGLHDYQLGEDPDLRMAFLSTKRDAVLLEGLSEVDPADFEADLLAATAELQAAHPERFASLIADGDGHTFLLRSFDREVAGTSVDRWVRAMLEGSDDWVLGVD